MTIPIKLLNELQNLEGVTIDPKLKIENLETLELNKEIVDEKTYRWELNCIFNLKYFIQKMQWQQKN